MSFVNERMNDNGRLWLAVEHENLFFSMKAAGKKARKLNIKVHSEYRLHALQSDRNKFAVQFTDNVDRLNGFEKGQIRQFINASIGGCC